jgi:hypothetical protein
MDPVTRAAKALGEALRGRLRAAPGGDPKRPAATRIVLEHASPKDLVSALRLAEHHPESRYPFVLFDGPFGDERGFLAGAGAIVARDEQALREGLGEDGLVVAEAAPSLPLSDAAAFGAALGRWARALTPTLDGLVVGLVPSSVRDAEGYRRVVETVLAHAAGQPIHVLVRDFGDPALAGMCPEVVTHALDPAEVARHLANLGSGAGAKGAPEREGAGPAAGPVTVDGKPVLSEAGGAALRRWLLEAGEASSRGAFAEAVKKLRAARMSCHLAGLTREEAIVEVSLGTAHFSAGEVERALAAYARGKGLALAAGVEGGRRTGVFRCGSGTLRGVALGRGGGGLWRGRGAGEGRGAARHRGRAAARRVPVGAGEAGGSAGAAGGDVGESPGGASRGAGGGGDGGFAGGGGADALKGRWVGEGRSLVERAGDPVAWGGASARRRHELVEGGAERGARTGAPVRRAALAVWRDGGVPR